MEQNALMDAVGTLAACLTTVAFVPQVVKTLKTRHTKDISMSMWVLFCTGVALWLVYGLMLGAWPIILANLFTLMLAGTVLIIKIGNRATDRDAP